VSGKVTPELGDNYMKKYDIGMIGLAVMGENLVLNMESKGFSVAAYDIAVNRMKEFNKNRAKGKNIKTASSLKELVLMLSKPRKVMMMIKAGNPVDEVILQLVDLLEEGDIIIDGGNSHFPDTDRRTKFAESKNLLYIGTGVSGGEEGALKGPSIMPGGSSKAWPLVKPLFQAIAAKTANNEICCDWVGDNGAGHFVKMVHNGIEYGDIQLITETYHIMRDLLKMTASEIHNVFKEWNKTELNSYLIEITANIFTIKAEDGSPLIDKILDTAGQKGTGKWTAISSLHEGVALPLIGEAVYARCLSAIKNQRVQASKIYNRKLLPFEGNKEEFILQLKDALYVAKITSYTQGFALMREASKSYNWNLDYGKISVLWKGGCIIRSVFLDKIKQAFEKNPTLDNLLIDSFFKQEIESRIDNFRQVIATAILSGIPLPTLSSSIAYFDGYTTANLPANLLQAQRDYFGAHTYERNDKPRGEFFHTNWTGKGGKTSSTTYNV